MALICGFAAIFGAAAPAGAATESFSLSSAPVPGQSSVGWQVGLGNPPATPNTWADPITLNGQIDSTTGAISAASLSMPSITQPPTDGETPTFTFTEVHPGTATGTYNATTGAVTLNDVLSLSFHIDPLGNTCISSPIDVTLSGIYDSTTQDVTLATTSSFTIPPFPTSPNCIGPVAAGINASPGGVAGSVGNSMSLALNGQFKPGLPTTTTLAASPPSPQPAGTSVTLTTTVTDPSAAGTPDGNVNFLSNGAVIGTEALSPSGTTGTATATYSTSTLPGGTNQLSAAYTGSTTYAASTSATQSYVIQAAPTISANVPQQATVGAAAQQFTLTVSNPSSGQSYPNVYLNPYIATTTGIGEPSAADRPVFSYEDSAGNWCAMPYAKSSTVGGNMYYSGAGAPPCGAPLSSISLNAGTTVSIPMEVTFPAGGNAGTEPFAVYLYTGTCASATSCTPTGPLSTKGVELLNTSITVLPAAGPGTVAATVTDGEANRPATTTVQQGFAVTLVADVTGVAGNYAYPTGTLQFLVDGQSAGVAEVSRLSSCPSTGGCESTTTGAGSVSPPLFYSTANLAPGTHTVLMNYSGDQMFAPASMTETFTVVAGPPAGTLFTCDVANNQGLNPLPFSAYVTATALGIPATAFAGATVNASAISVTLNLDGADYAYSNNLSLAQTAATIDFSPTGSATAGPITFSGTGTSLSVAGTWTGMSDAVAITGAPGTQVAIGVSSISFSFGVAGGTAQCTPVEDAAPLGTVTVAGNTLTASPTGSAAAGAPVTLTDTVYPAPPLGTAAGTWGQVDFYDGTTDLGTVPVVSTTSTTALPPNNGTATFTTAALAVGDHQLTAIWSGASSVPSNTSNTVDYSVGTATTTALASSANPANAANPVTFTATVTPPQGASTQPTGDVSFTSDGNAITSCQNVALSMASPPTATCTTSFAAGQSHAIVATYTGDATYLGSASDTLTQTTLPGTNTTILSTKDPSPAGNVQFWSGVSPSSGKGATPTGTVAFSIDGSTYKPCASQPLGPGGGASCTVSFKAGTSHKVFATYAGSSSYSGSKSNTITQTVTGAKSSTTPKDTAGSATLASGKSLTAGQSISTGAYRLAMQSDGNLVEYRGSKALWASGTFGYPGTGVVMQKDGNLVEYQSGTAIWASNTSGHAGAHLTLQGSDGNVVIYQGTTALWATGT